MRLLLTVFASIFITFLLVVGLRWFGSTSEHLARRHEFLDNGPSLFSWVGDKSLSNYPSLNNMVETRKNRKNLGWALPIYVENDQLVVRIEDKSILLHVILETFKQDYFFFLIMSNTVNVNYLLSEQIKNYEIENRVLLFSPYRNVILQFRDLRPQWLTALSTPEANFYFLMHKVWLETIAPFAADFMWLDKNDSIWLHDLSTPELFRRKKFLICDKTIAISACKAVVSDTPSLTTDQTSSSNAAEPNN